MNIQDLTQDVELSFKLFEFALRTMNYFESDRLDSKDFGWDFQLNLKEENVSYPKGEFTDAEEIRKFSEMNISTVFGATAICLNRLLEHSRPSSENMRSLVSLVAAVRNAFSHAMASPDWYVKPHKYEVINLDFIQGPIVDLKQLNSMPFEYSNIGGLAVWYRVKEYVLENT